MDLLSFSKNVLTYFYLLPPCERHCPRTVKFWNKRQYSHLAYISQLPISRKSGFHGSFCRGISRPFSPGNKKSTGQIAGAFRARSSTIYGRVLPFPRVFEFMFEFMFDLMFEFEFDMFALVIGVEIGVDIGVGLAMFVFIRFVLLTVLFEVTSPQAAPSVPSANTAVSAIFFMLVIISCLLQSISVLLTAQMAARSN
jgi:hypothetical protein